MSRFNGKVVVPSLVALSLALVGGVYAMGRGSINPFRGNAAEDPADDSTTFARTMYNRCGRLGGDAKIDCYSIIGNYTGPIVHIFDVMAFDRLIVKES